MVPLVRKTSIIREILLNKGSTSPVLNENELTFDEIKQRPKRESRKLSSQQVLGISKEALNDLKKSSEYNKKMSIYEEKSLKLCPTVDGRIICIKDREVSKEKCLTKLYFFH